MIQANRSNIIQGHTENKKARVTGMFNKISRNYDFLNHLLSFGIDRSWRKKLVNAIAGSHPKKILDLATGTGDLAISLSSLNPEMITGIDLAEKMLEIGRNKIKSNGLSDKIKLKKGDSESLEFESNSFDAVTVAFGIRNFENLNAGLSEAYRVLKPGGTFAILEFSKPEKFPFSLLYSTYFNFLLPLIGKIISSDSSAYTYLPESVKKFPYSVALANILIKNGFLDVTFKPLTLGICSLYTGRK